MHSSECRDYAVQCLELAREVAPEFRERLVALAEEWSEAADDLEMRENQQAMQRWAVTP